jgi:hypothetical protein
MTQRHFRRGERVRKILGYKFPGVVVAKFRTTRGDLRYVVEAVHIDFDGMLHIYAPEQLEGEGSAPAKVSPRHPVQRNTTRQRNPK